MENGILVLLRSGSKLTSGNRLEIAFFGGGVANWAIGKGVATADHLGTGDGHQIDGFHLARLKAHRRARGNIEALAKGGGAIEAQVGVGFAKVEVTANLDGTVRGIGDLQGGGWPAGVELDGAFGAANGAWGLARIILSGKDTQLGNGQETAV